MFLFGSDQLHFDKKSIIYYYFFGSIYFCLEAISYTLKPDKIFLL